MAVHIGPLFSIVRSVKTAQDACSLIGQYWDPGEKLQKAIADTRNLLQGNEINWDKVNKDVQWLGVNFEQEVRDVRRDKQFDRGSGDGE